MSVVMQLHRFLINEWLQRVVVIRQRPVDKRVTVIHIVLLSAVQACDNKIIFLLYYMKAV